MTFDRDELLAQVATRYYLQDQSQQQIATDLTVSRSNISRLLKEARERGIVEIRIRHPLRRNDDLEQQLRERFGLRDAGVVNVRDYAAGQTLARTVELAARILDQSLEDGQILAISWGTAVDATINAFVPSRRYDVEVVAMMGGVAPDDPAIDGPALAQRAARKLTNRYRYLHAPLRVGSPEIAQGLLTQPNVATTLHLIAQADVALVGIGALQPEISSLLRAGYLTPEEFEHLLAAGAVGDIAARHYDRHGRAVAMFDDRLISATLEDLNAIGTVIAVASSSAKADAILGALRGGWPDVLVTDSETATAVLERS